MCGQNNGLYYILTSERCDDRAVLLMAGDTVARVQKGGRGEGMKRTPNWSEGEG